MHTVYQKVAGLDVHKKTVVATHIQVTKDGRLDREMKAFGTTTPDLLRLHDSLPKRNCTPVTKVPVTTRNPSLACWQGPLKPCGKCAACKACAGAQADVKYSE